MTDVRRKQKKLFLAEERISALEAERDELRRLQAEAQAKAAGLLSPEAPSLEISQRSDQATGNNGLRETVVLRCVFVFEHFFYSVLGSY